MTLLMFLNSKVESYLHEGGDILKELDDVGRIRLGIESASWKGWKKKERRPSLSLSLNMMFYEIPKINKEIHRTDKHC